MISSEKSVGNSAEEIRKRRPFLKSLALLPFGVSLGELSASEMSMASRQVAVWLDATGTCPADGHRVLELGLIELGNWSFTGQSLHFYIDPARGVEEGAKAVHGLDLNFFAGMPTFRDIAANVSSFISGATLIVVNPGFTVAFLDHEFLRLGMPSVSHQVSTVVGTWEIAKRKWPTHKNDLNSVSERVGVPVTDRDALAKSIQVARTSIRLRQICNFDLG